MKGVKFVGNVNPEYMFTADGEITAGFRASGNEKAKVLSFLAEMKTSLKEGKEAVKYVIDIKKYSPKRSLDANAYFHLLVDKIAEQLRIGNDECKVKMVLEYGTVATDEEGAKVGIKLPKSVNVNSIYPYAKWFDEREENGKKFNCYLIYKQTHTLDSKEMSRLIEGVVYEAQELGIKTATPDEIAQMEGIREK